MLYSAKVMVVGLVVVENFARVWLCESQNEGARVCTLAKIGPIFCQTSQKCKKFLDKTGPDDA